MAIHDFRSEMTEREREEFEQEKEAARLQGEYNLRIKEMDTEIARLEAKWTNILRLPIVIITLPVKVVMAFGYLIAVIRKQEPSESFWKYLGR